MYFTPDFKKELVAQTGQRGWLYLDRTGQVLLGVHHVVKTEEEALALRFVAAGAPSTKVDTEGEAGGEPEPASKEAISANWAAVLEMRTNRQYGSEFLPEFYRELASPALLLPDKEVLRLLEGDLAEIEAEMRKVLPTFHRFPQPAKEVVVELGFHLGIGFLSERRHAGLREALLAEEWNEVPGLCPKDEPGKFGEERRRFRQERLARAVEIAAAEVQIEEKVTALLQSLDTLADTAKVELKKIETQVGELADDLVHKAKDFLKNLGSKMAEINIAEAIEADLARIRAQRAESQKEAPTKEEEAAEAAPAPPKDPS